MEKPQQMNPTMIRFGFIIMAIFVLGAIFVIGDFSRFFSSCEGFTEQACAADRNVNGGGRRTLSLVVWVATDLILVTAWLLVYRRKMATPGQVSSPPAQ